MAKSEQKSLARYLRADKGYSVKQIAAELKVSTSTISLWVRDIELTTAQKQRLKDAIKVAARVKSEKAAKLRAEYQQQGHELAKVNDLFRLLCMAYWAEGTKYSRSHFIFTNTDPKMIRFVIRIIQSLSLAHRIRLEVLHYQPTSQTAEELEIFWKESISPCEVDSFKVRDYSRGIQKTTNWKGIARVMVGSVRLRQMIDGGIQFLQVG